MITRRRACLFPQSRQARRYTVSYYGSSRWLGGFGRLGCSRSSGARRCVSQFWFSSLCPSLWSSQFWFSSLCPSQFWFSSLWSSQFWFSSLCPSQFWFSSLCLSLSVAVALAVLVLVAVALAVLAAVLLTDTSMSFLIFSEHTALSEGLQEMTPHTHVRGILYI